MPRIIAIEADSRRRSTLRSLVNEHVRAELFIADSVGAAIAQMNHRMPDVVLVPALLSPQDAAVLSEHVKQLQGAPYVQLLTIPAFDMLGEPESSDRRRLGFFRRQAPSLRRYDRAMVGSQIADAVERAREARAEYVAWLGHQAELEELEKIRAARRAANAAQGALVVSGPHSFPVAEASDDRRTALRKPLGDLPWLSNARLAWGAEISLVNISTSGVLLESGSKFAPGSSTDLHLSGPQTNLVVPVRFVRSEIAKIDSMGVRYRAAAAFGQEIDLTGPLRARETPATPPQALAALLETSLRESGAEPAHARFVRGVRELVGAREVQLRAGVSGAAGRESLYFEVPGGDRARGVLHVVFDRNHEVTPAQLKLLKAAALLTAATLEFDRPEPTVSDSPKPVALLEACVA
jgi:hypothetical protein